MKVIFMTQPDKNGISDVFNTAVLTEENVAEPMRARWQEIVDASPIKPLIVVGKENVAATSVWNPESETFTLGEGITPDHARSLNEKCALFLINNVVKGVIVMPLTGVHAQILEAAFSDEVTMVSLEDDSPVSVGYTWNGTEFISPLE